MKFFEVDLKALNKNPEHHALSDPDGLGIGTPFDCPAYVQCWRVMEPTEEHDPPNMNSTGLRGHIITVDFFTIGVEVQMRLGRTPRTLKVVSKDSDGLTVLEQWSME